MRQKPLRQGSSNLIKTLYSCVHFVPRLLVKSLYSLERIFYSYVEKYIETNEKAVMNEIGHFSSLSEYLL